MCLCRYEIVHFYGIYSLPFNLDANKTAMYRVFNENCAFSIPLQPKPAPFVSSLPEILINVLNEFSVQAIASHCCRGRDGK